MMAFTHAPNHMSVRACNADFTTTWPSPTHDTHTHISSLVVVGMVWSCQKTTPKQTLHHYTHTHRESERQKEITCSENDTPWGPRDPGLYMNCTPPGYLAGPPGFFNFPSGPSGYWFSLPGFCGLLGCPPIGIRVITLSMIMLITYSRSVITQNFGWSHEYSIPVPYSIFVC